MKYNTPRQNKNCLKHFDLSEYRQILSDLAIRIYHQFIIVMENNIQHIIGKTTAVQEDLNVACEVHEKSLYREAEGGTHSFLLILIDRCSCMCISAHKISLNHIFPDFFLKTS